MTNDCCSPFLLTRHRSTNANCTVHARRQEHGDMATEQLTQTSTVPALPATAGDVAFKSVADLIKLLPTGTVFAYQFLSPLLTNSGHCSAANKAVTGVQLFLCSFSCCFASFTDSYLDVDGKIYYGVVTAKGLWIFSDPNPGTSRDLSKYKLRLGDFAHAAVALAVFAVIMLLDKNTVSCYYPSFASDQETVIMVLPAVVSAFASSVFGVFPSTRHGIGHRSPCCFLIA